MKNYTETETFKEEAAKLAAQGISPEIVNRYMEIMSNFDENGMDVGTNYDNMVLAFEHPLP